MDKYQEIEKIGKGSFGDVYRCLDSVTGYIVAVKKIVFKDEFEGVPNSIIREISILKEMEHGNIVRLLDVLNDEYMVYLVFEFLELDLRTFIKSPELLRNPPIIKKIMHQILRGVAYCHAHKILHRDLKPQNLLIDLCFRTVKIADFGLARAVGVPLKAYTREVATPWYKAPELLLGSHQYSYPIDVWSVGCIFGEMVIRRPLFAGESEIDQLLSIFSILGTPNEETWPGVTSFCKTIAYLPRGNPKDLAKEFYGLEPAGVDLLSRMLCLNPSKRITARDALSHGYFN